MPSSRHWPDAALGGLACSMRTSAGPALLAARRQISGKARIGMLVASAAEFTADKTPAASDRTDAPGLIPRVLSGGYTGHEIAGPAGAAAGAIGAGVGSYATWRARKLVVETTGLPDPAVAVAEDLVAVALAAIATRASAIEDGSDDSDAQGEPSESADAPPGRSLLRDAATGLFAGVVATAAMTIAQGAEFVLTDAQPSSAPADVADKLKRRAGQGKLKRSQRRAANQMMHWLYGTSWGIPYGIVAAGADVAPEVSGPVFGLLVWGAGLAHQPALGIADVPWKRSLSSLGGEALFHLVYGIGAGAALRAARNARSTAAH